MLLFLLLIITLCLCFALYNKYNYWSNRGVKNPKPCFFFGHSWNLLSQKLDMANYVSYYYNQMQDVRYYGLYRFWSPILMVRDPELIKNITVKDFDHFTDHVAMVDPKADKLFGKNVLGLRGDEWKAMRSTLTPSFTSSRIKMMFELICEAAENYVNYFLKEGSDVVEVEAKETFSRYTTDVIATTSFGVKVDSLGDKDNDFRKMGKEISEIRFSMFVKILLRQLSPKLADFLNLTMFRQEVNEFFTTLIHDTLSTREAQQIYRPDMLQVLIEARNKQRGKMDNLTNEDITAQALIFFFAGFDSVSSAMTFMSYELAVNQDIQDKLREEIYQTLEEHSGKITYEEISQMKYLNMVVLETLRKWPPFVILGRECTKTYVIEAASPNERKLTIPKGMSIQIPLYAIHHDAQYFPEPEKFIPERFASETKHPGVFLPFGQGPRGCLGSRFAIIEIKTIFFYILKNFKLVTTENTQIPVKIIKKFAINIRPEDGLHIGLQKL